MWNGSGPLRLRWYGSFFRRAIRRTKGAGLPEQKTFVAAEIGLHARAAAVFVRAVTETGLPITIRKQDGLPVDARSLLEVMTEDFEQGCEVFLAVAPEALSAGHTLPEVENALVALSAVLEGTQAR
ncbi:Phosphocarrier protein HPr [compost metagenome]